MKEKSFKMTKGEIIFCLGKWIGNHAIISDI